MWLNPRKPKNSWTYQELSTRFGVDVRTIGRWFKKYKCFRPTKGTVRVPQSSMDQFLKDSCL